MANAGDISVVLKAEKKQYEQDLKAAEKQAKDFASNLGKLTIGGGFLSIGGIKDFVSSLGTTGKVAGTTIGVLTALTAAAIAYADSQAKMVTEQRKVAGSLALTTQQVQVFDSAFNKFGISIEQSHSALSTFEDVLSSAKLGAEAATIKLASLGFSMQQINNLQADEALRKVLENVSKLGTAAQREATLFTVLGSQARDFLQVVENGKAGVDAFFDNATTKSSEMNDNFVQFGKVVKNIQGELKDATTSWADSLLGVFLKYDHILKMFKDKDVIPKYVSFDEEYDAREKAKKADASASQREKRNEANKGAFSEFLKIHKAMESFRNEPLKAWQEINEKYREASPEVKQQLFLKKVMQERQEIQGKFVDQQDAIIAGLNWEDGVRRKINKELQFASKEQKEQAFTLEKQKMGSPIFDSLRKQSIGGASFFRKQDIAFLEALKKLPKEFFPGLDKLIEFKKKEDALKIKTDLGGTLSPREEYERRIAELESNTELTADQRQYGKVNAHVKLMQDSLHQKEELGGTVTAKETYKVAIAKIDADTGLTPEQRKFGKENASIKLRDETESLLQSLGKIENPLFKFGQDMEKAQLAFERGEINKTQYNQVRSDLAEKFAPTKLGGRVDANSSEGYERLAKYFSGVDKQAGDPQKKIVDGINRGNGIMKTLPKEIARALQGEVDRI